MAQLYSHAHDSPMTNVSSCSHLVYLLVPDDVHDVLLQVLGHRQSYVGQSSSDDAHWLQYPSSVTAQHISVESHEKPSTGVSTLLESAYVFVGVATHIANDKPTFRFGKKWEIKNAEIWD